MQQESPSSAALSNALVGCAAALLRPNGAIHNIYVIVKVIVNISLQGRPYEAEDEYGRLSAKRMCARERVSVAIGEQWSAGD